MSLLRFPATWMMACVNKTCSRRGIQHVNVQTICQGPVEKNSNKGRESKRDRGRALLKYRKTPKSYRNSKIRGLGKYREILLERVQRPTNLTREMAGIQDGGFVYLAA